MTKDIGWREAAVSGSLAAVVGAVLPLQTYLGNSASFAFSLPRLLPELVGIWAMFTVGTLLVGWLLAKLQRWLPAGLALPSRYFAILAAAAVCVYLESGILSLGIPELNGGPVPALANPVRALVDAGVWAAVLVGFVLLARRLRPCLHWIALAALALSAAALFDVAAPSASGSPSPSPADSTLAFESQPTVVANAEYSPTRNILVFVLDSMPGRVAVEALAADPALCEKFAGFTAYPENIGMHDCTKRGVPGLVTGRYFDPSEMSEADYPMTMYGTNSFVRAADAAGWGVAFSPDLLPYGATNLRVERRVARVEERRSRDAFAFLRQSTEVPFLSLVDLVAFRLSPFAFKAPILYSRIRHAVKGRHSSEGFWGEGTLYPQLAARPVSGEERPFLGFFHSWGVHPPWPGKFADVASAKFAALGELLDAYRAAGVYDRSLIVVTSDHGLLGTPPIEGYPSPASALLMVKPEGARTPFAVSPLRTSHAGIAPLVRAALAAPPDAARCDRMLRDDHPLHRSEEREGGRDVFRDWRR